MSSEWKSLIQRFKPEDKRICNCGNAYESFFPASTKGCMNGAGEYIDHWACAYGCSSAQISARDHVAKCVLAEKGSS